MDCQLFDDEIEQDSQQNSAVDTEESECAQVESVETSKQNNAEDTVKTLASTDRRELMHKDTMNVTGNGYFYRTGKIGYFLMYSLLVWYVRLAHIIVFHEHYSAYFDRINTKPSLAASSGDDDATSESIPRDIYKSLAEEENYFAGVKWYNRLWRLLPFTSYWLGAFSYVESVICSVAVVEMMVTFKILLVLRPCRHVKSLGSFLPRY